MTSTSVAAATASQKAKTSSGALVVLAEPAKRVLCEITEQASRSGGVFGWFQTETLRATEIKTSAARSRIDLIHCACQQVVELAPSEAYSYLWNVKDIRDTVMKLNNEDYIELLEALCPRHKGLAQSSKGAVVEKDFCTVISLLKSLKKYLESWYAIGSDITPAPPKGSVLYVCSKEQVKPLADFISHLSLHYADVYESQVALEKVIAKKRQRIAEKSASDQAKVQELPPTITVTSADSNTRSPDQERSTSAQ